MARPGRKPHLIFLMADQLRSDVLGAYGSNAVPTPAIDALAKHASLFRRHFTPCPLCVPARSALMTGLEPHRNGAVINGWFEQERRYGAVREGVPLLPEALVQAGYRVAHIGVQHVRTSPPFDQRLPEVEVIGPTSMGAHLQDLEQRGLMLGDLKAVSDPVIDYCEGRPVVGRATSPRTSVFPLREDLFFDSILADRMVETIQGHGGDADDRPLAMFGMFWLPHPPLWAPRRFAEMIDPDEVHLRSDVGRWFNGTPAAALANIPGQLGAHVSTEQWKLAWAMYLGMTALLDECVGRVLKALEAKGMLDDALVVFTSDHGEMLGSRMMFQKMCMYEPAVRVPMIMKLPAQRSSRTVWDLTTHLDLTATLTDLAGAAPLPQTTGRSLVSPAEGLTADPQTPYVFASYDGNAGRSFHQRMVRSRTHKLIHHQDDRAELYDLIEDPRETQNLAASPDHEPVFNQLAKALNTWLDRMEDPIARL